MRSKKFIITATAATAAIAGAITLCTGASKGGTNPGQVSYTTATVARGDVAATITASGTIEPEELIDVGSQVSGQILEFGKDAEGGEIDYCSEVRAGDLMAKIDDVTYVADLDVAKAQLSNANAAVISARANLEQAQATLKKAAKSWGRAKSLGVGEALSQSAYDGYEADYDIAMASVAVAEAGINQSEAQVVQARASVEKAERNLGYCTITAPVDGVVIDRRVNKGQTIVSSMSASSLFLLATDLRHIQIWVAVNEADVGQLKVGMPVKFTVDAFPGRSFAGKVKRIRLNATVTSNVVTYTVEVETENVDGILLPYLTANVQFMVNTQLDALVVPARALRWRPDGMANVSQSDAEGTVFTLDASGTPIPRKVRILLSNGSDAAIEGEGISEGVSVITGASGAVAARGAPAVTDDPGSNNPFMAKMPKPPKGAGGPPGP